MKKNTLGLKIGGRDEKGVFTPVIGWAIMKENDGFKRIDDLTEDKIMAKARQLIGSHFKEIREMAGITPKKAAELSKLTEQEYLDVEKGEEISFDHFLKAVRGVNCQFFFQAKE